MLRVFAAARTVLAQDELIFGICLVLLGYVILAFALLANKPQ